jgi:hypothetical protein
MKRITKYKRLVFCAILIAATMLQIANGENSDKPNLDNSLFPKPPDALYKELTTKQLIIKPVEGGKSGDQGYYAYLAPGEYFTKITTHWWSAIDGLELATSSGQTLTFGSTDGVGDHREQTHHDSFTLTKDQYITSVVVKTGDFKPHSNNYRVITGITFVIHNKDGSLESKHFGEPTGSTLAADPGQEICGFWGWHGSVLDCIGIITREHK